MKLSARNVVCTTIMKRYETYGTVEVYVEINAFHKVVLKKE